MAHKDPYKTDRKAQDKERVDKFLGRKSGGRVKDDDGTNIHIEINASDKAQGAEDTPLPPPMAGPAPPPPPMPPMIPPPGPGGPMGGGGPIGLKRGGRATSNHPPGPNKPKVSTHPPGPNKPKVSTHPPGPNPGAGPRGPRMRKDGGGVHQAKASTMDAGAGSGEGRLEKIGKRP